MRKKTLLVFLILVSILLSVFCACVTKNNTQEEGVLTSIEVDESTVPTNAVIGHVDVTQIQLILHYGSKTKRITIKQSMLKEESLAKLNEVGTHQFTVVYQQKTAKFQMEIHDNEIKYYTLRVYGGVPTYVNNKKLVNAITLPESGFYENTYPDGTVVTIQWINDGNNFSYWTANDLPVSSESITNVVVDGNYVYRPYSTPAVSTVSFKTFSSSVVQSKTTNRLFETDIPAVFRDNYIFAGWTTDEITEEQSIAGYSTHIVSFPFDVNRNITFYATWIPMGIIYERVGDHYEVVGYEGNALGLDIPEKYDGADVAVVRASAFSGTQAKKLRSITLPASVKTIEEGAFKNCSHLSSIVVNDSSYYRSTGGVLYSADGKELIAYPANKPAARYVVEGAVETIDSYAFFDAMVGSVVVPSSVDKIGTRAFDSVYIDNVDLSALSPTNLTLPTALFNEKIDKVVCASSSRELLISLFPVIASITDKTVLSAKDTNAVYLSSYDEADGQNISVLYRVLYDKNLVDESVITNDKESYATAEILGVDRRATTFAIPIRLAQPGERAYTVASLADCSFKGCTLLKNVVISFSSKLERIGDDVFNDTPWIETIENDTLRANGIVYKYLGTNAVYTLDKTATKIAEGAFRGNTTLRYVDIGENVALTTIGPSAFDGCTSLVGFICSANPQGDGLYLKYAVRSVGERAFRNTAVTSVKLQPSSTQQINCLTTIGSAAFENCCYLTSVTLSRSTVNVADDAFVGCVSLQGFVLSEKNPVFEVYEGILYSYDANKNYTLFTYPAGRLDGEFDPSYVRLYAYSLDCDLREYDGGTAVPVGTVVLNGEKEDIYLIVKSGIEWTVEYDFSGENYYLQSSSGARLLPSEWARVKADGAFVMSGDYCYFILSEDGTKQIPLLYDKIEDAYYYYPVTRRSIQSISVDLSLYEESVDKSVGSVVIAGKKFVVYLNVQDGIQIAKTSTDVVPKNKVTNEKLRQTTTLTENDDGTFTADGEFYYYVYLDDDKTKKTVLLYDSVSGGYGFDGYLNVTAIGSNAFSYSSISAVRISSLIESVGESAFNVPGLLYVRFDSNPSVFSYGAFFGEYETEYVLLSDKLSASDKMSFFDNNSDLMNEKSSTESYRFFYDNNDADILYVLREEDMNLYVARASRVSDSLVVAENVVFDGVTYTQVKKVLPYAFYGVYLKSVTLRGVGALSSNAFSKASALTALYVECDFISDIQDDTFGPLFHNGMYIYDSINGFNLYRESKWVPADSIFTYTDVDGMEQSACPYLVLTENKKTFAVIAYVDGSGVSRTIDVYYDKVTTENVADVQERVAREGYDIVGWQNAQGVIVSGSEDYFVPYNQILTCVWAPQKYKVYFVVSEGEVKKVVDNGNVDLPAKRNETTGLVTYVSEVTYEEAYAFSFVGFDVLKTVFLRWKDDSETGYESTGVWSTVLDSREIYLYPVTEARKYRIVYSVESDVTVSAVETYVTYDASGWTLDVPTCTDYTFLGWYMIGEEGNKIILTDGRGQSLLSWRYASEDEYTVYALWNTILLYGADVGITSESVEYNKNFDLEVPENINGKTFVGWFIREEDGTENMITDAFGHSLAPWSSEGKKQYRIFAKWRQNE